MSDALPNSGPEPVTKEQAICEAVFLLMWVKVELFKNGGNPTRKIQAAADKASVLLGKCDIPAPQLEAELNTLLRSYIDGTAMSPLAIPNAVHVLNKLKN